MITHTWNILKLSALKELDSQQNVIYQVDWEYITTDGETSEKTVGSTSLDRIIDNNFVSYENLTKEIIASWIEEKLGEDQMESMRQINTESIGYLKNLVELSPPSS